MILVTGGTGLVGAHLLYKLTSLGESVRAIHRSSSNLNAVKEVFEYFTDDVEALFSKIEWVEADVTNIPQLTKAFTNITHVYHGAALISFDPKDYKQLRKINIEGTHNIVNLCIANNIKKLCYVSSVAAVGKPIIQQDITEDTPWNPEADNNVYAITKYGAEMEVWRGTQEGVDAVIVNPGIILGAGFWHQGSGALLKIAKRGVPYYTTGTTGFVDVIDVVEAMLQLMNSSIVNQRYILVAENISFGELFTKIAKRINSKPPTKKIKKWQLAIAWRLDWLASFLFGKKRRLTRFSAKSLLSNNNFSNQKIKDDLNFTFTPIEETLDFVCNKFTL
jgi:nucleoside-diphosphate-sugar epimerase